MLTSLQCSCSSCSAIKYPMRSLVFALFRILVDVDWINKIDLVGSIQTSLTSMTCMIKAAWLRSTAIRAMCRPHSCDAICTTSYSISLINSGDACFQSVRSFARHRRHAQDRVTETEAHHDEEVEPEINSSEEPPGYELDSGFRVDLAYRWPPPRHQETEALCHL